MKRLKANPEESVTKAPSAIRLALVGAGGRMGRSIASLVDDDPSLELAVAVQRGSALSRECLDASGIGVVVDFSSDAGTGLAIELALASRAALLVGTTGLSPNTLARARDASRVIPAMVAPNFSVGIAILRRLVAEAARLAGPEWDLDLVESHHRDKRDAPSGTAILLAEEAGRVLGRDDLPSRIHSIRSGGVPGEHEVRLAAAEESLLLRHAAFDRRVFARGALRAAKWLVGRRPGWHAFEEVVAG